MNKFYYQAFVNPRDGYAYPVAIASDTPLEPDAAKALMRERCYFLVAEEANDLDTPVQITKDEFDAVPDPDTYIEKEYGFEDAES